jgi:hypothetical protein
MEESVEHFIVQWKPYATPVRCFPRVEGSPLVEVQVLGHILHVFERTNPYHLVPGPAMLILNPMTEQVTPTEADSPGLEVIGLSRIKAWGRILVRQPYTVVIDAGVPLVVSVLDGVPGDVALGDRVTFTSTSPIHGFALAPEPPVPAPPTPEAI